MKNPNVAKLEWKAPMLERYKKMTDVAVLQDYSTRYIRKAIRVNTCSLV